MQYNGEFAPISFTKNELDVQWYVQKWLPQDQVWVYNMIIRQRKGEPLAFQREDYLAAPRSRLSCFFEEFMSTLIARGMTTE